MFLRGSPLPNSPKKNLSVCVTQTSMCLSDRDCCRFLQASSEAIDKLSHLKYGTPHIYLICLCRQHCCSVHLPLGSDKSCLLDKFALTSFTFIFCLCSSFFHIHTLCYPLRRAHLPTKKQIPIKTERKSLERRGGAISASSFFLI